jgi:hypothetical protein
MRSRPLTRALRAGALFATAVAFAGCSRPVGTVSGKVSHQGKALKGGSVSFVSSEGLRSFSAGIKSDGTYQIPDLIGGDYKVCVETESLKPARAGVPTYPGQAAQPAVPKGKGGPPPGAAVPEGYTPSDPASAAAANNAKRYVAIPAKYGDPKTTTLDYTFKGGTETHDIDLQP